MKTYCPALDQRRNLLLRAARLMPAAIAFPALLPRLASAKNLVLTPSQSEGPFYPDQALQDADFDLLKNGTVAYSSSQPAWLSGLVMDQNGKPVSGAVVEIWQCDHTGVYRHSRSSGNSPMAFQGFGKVQVGGDGQYRFRTIKPEPYAGRTPHIHMKIKLGNKELLTTQIYVAGDPANDRDGLFRRLSGEQRNSLAAPFTRGNDGWQAQFGVVVLA